MESIEEQKKLAIAELEKLEQNKITLPRDVFFVPGWTGESCSAWLNSYSPENTSMRQWAERIIANWQEKVHFLVFDKISSEKCRSFIDFGKILYEKIRSCVNNDSSRFDLIGHSMGGLDISAAVIYGAIPSDSVGKIMTLGSPFHGAEWGQMMKEVGRLSGLFLGVWVVIRLALIKMGYTPYHILQLKNMDPKGKMIKAFNTKENRIRLLNTIEKLYTFFGTDDDTVKESALFNGFDIDKGLLDRKLQAVCIEGATHSGSLGLTQDPRVVLNIVKIISA